MTKNYFTLALVVIALCLTTACGDKDGKTSGSFTMKATEMSPDDWWCLVRNYSSADIRVTIKDQTKTAAAFTGYSTAYIFSFSSNPGTVTVSYTSTSKVYHEITDVGNVSFFDK